MKEVWFSLVLWHINHCRLSNTKSIFIHIIIIIIISMTLSRHSSLSFIASGRSSELHPVFSQSCCVLVRADRPAFARPYDRVHWSTSLMSSSLILQQCPACLVPLTLRVSVMGGCTVRVLWGVASRTCSKLLAASLCSYRQAFSPSF